MEQNGKDGKTARGGFAKPTKEQLAKRYNHHPPVGNQAAEYGQVREAIKQCAETCVELTPVCPEQTRALNALDEAMFLFNAAKARHEPRGAAAAGLAGTGEQARPSV